MHKYNISLNINIIISNRILKRKTGQTHELLTVGSTWKSIFININLKVVKSVCYFRVSTIV